MAKSIWEPLLTPNLHDILLLATQEKEALEEAMTKLAEGKLHIEGAFLSVAVAQ